MSIKYVLFVRLRVASQDDISQALAKYYAVGWRVVSHTDDGDEYSFVFERDADPRDK